MSTRVCTCVDVGVLVYVLGTSIDVCVCVLKYYWLT